MDLGITGKKAFVMASSKGLGRGVAMQLAAEGCEVAICGRNEESLILTATDIAEQTGQSVHYAVGDVSIRAEREQLLDTVMEQLGHIDILVTNSGGPPAGAFEEHGLDTWQQTYELLLENTVHTIQLCLPAMEENKWGRIITITSQAIKQPVPGLILSNAVRGSLLGLTKTLSQELGHYGITVNNVMPGYTKTDRLNKLLEANPAISEATKDIPLGRFGEVEEFASAVAFLCSERASYITGVSLPVDGGWIKGV